MRDVNDITAKITSALLTTMGRTIRSPRLYVLLAAGVGFLTPLSALADPYRLVPDDRISLRVVEWRSGEGEFKDWSVVNGVFLINDAGAVSIPLVGEVVAAGLTTKDLGDRIADLLQQRIGMPNKPYAAVEISQYGPIYVVGSVDKPGQYPYNPGLTVMKAISLAGGLERESDSAGSRLERDRIQAAGTLGSAELDYNGLLMRQARLRAELDGKDSFDIPAPLAHISGIEEIHKEELNLMKLRRVELQSKLDAAASLGELYSNQIDTLQSKIENQQHQIELLQKELSTVSSLVDRGLSLSSRRLSLDQNQSDAESTLLDLEFQMTRAKQSLEENKRDAAEVINSTNSDIQNELNGVAREIAKSDLQVRMGRLLIDETDQESQRLLEDTHATAKSALKLRIVRHGETGATERIDAMADTLIQPRDLIEVDDGTSRDGEVDTTSSSGSNEHLAASEPMQ